MGLFKKKPAIDPATVLALQAELAEVRTRLDAAEQGKAYLEARLGSLDATTTALSSNTTSRSEQLETQLTQIADLLHAAEQSRANRPASPELTEVLEPRLAELSTRLDDLAGQLSTPQPPSPEVTARLDQAVAAAGSVAALQQRLETLQGHVDASAALHHELEVLNERVGELQAHAGEADEVRMKVARLTETVEAVQASATAAAVSTEPPSTGGIEGMDGTDEHADAAEPSAPVSPVSSVSHEVADALTAQIAQLAERVSISANDARLAKEQAAALDARIASVGTELTNQLSELGREIDALAERQQQQADQPAVTAVAEISPEVLDALRTGQTRLANEQARYEIAFREDLATLAEQVRHIRGR